MKNGGYAIISHDDVNIFNKVDNAYNSGKPILFYDDDKTCYFIDTTKKVGDDYVLVKGGKTITITDANTVSSTGTVDNPTMENIKDLNGNLRFIEGELTTSTITGLTFTYTKWSLSGTHLMVVLTGNADNGVEIINETVVATCTLPEWVLNKITPVWSDYYIDLKTLVFRGDDWTTQNGNMAIGKTSTGLKLMIVSPNVTLNANRKFRIQFDLLIDAE